jgi:aspartyl-tRNA(Asn)/glutamyl-tRNA(Gln) amidotransferase subunit A
MAIMTTSSLHSNPSKLHPARVSIATAVAAMGQPAAQISAVALLQQAQANALRFASLNALAYVDWPGALAQAQALDAASAQLRSQGAPLGRLQGVPISIKDLFNVSGMPTRGGTRARLPALSLQEASLVTRLRRAGALVFAKTNMHEVALGATGENSWTKDVLNPFNPAHQAGGSSSGSSVAVATGIGLASVGSDTGGSVRIPAAFCGIVGFKPSYQAIPLDGALHLSWTCDHAGPLTNSVADARVMFEVMSGRVTQHSPAPLAPRFGVPSAWHRRRLAPEVAEDFAHCVERLAARGAQIVEIDLDQPLALAWEHYTTIVRAEGAHVHREVLASLPVAQQTSENTGFSDPVLAPLQAGMLISAAQYIAGLQAQQTGRHQMEACLTNVDAVLTPCSAVYPPLRGQAEVTAAQGVRISVREAVLGQTLAFSFYGLPTLSLPVHKTIEARGFPLGLQLVTSSGSDARTLALGEWVEAVLG